MNPAWRARQFPVALTATSLSPRETLSGPRAHENLFRALKYFQSDKWGIAVVAVLRLLSIELNVLKPWSLPLSVDNVLGKKPCPT